MQRAALEVVLISLATGALGCWVVAALRGVREPNNEPARKMRQFSAKMILLAQNR